MHFHISPYSVIFAALTAQKSDAVEGSDPGFRKVRRGRHNDVAKRIIAGNKKNFYDEPGRSTSISFIGVALLYCKAIFN